MASGSIVGYQGFAKDTVGRIAKLSPGATIDPLDPSMFITYATNANQSRMQAMAFLENGNFATAFEGIISSAHAGAGSNYTQRYVINIGDNVGILIENTGSNINRPIQEKYVAGSFTGIDLAATTTSSGYTMVFSKSDTTASATTSGTSAYTGSLFTFVYNKNADLMKDKSLASLDSTLVAYWDMETLTGTLLKDLSGNGNNGTCYNGSGNVVNCGTTGL